MSSTVEAGESSATRESRENQRRRVTQGRVPPAGGTWQPLIPRSLGGASSRGIALSQDARKGRGYYTGGNWEHVPSRHRSHPRPRTTTEEEKVMDVICKTCGRVRFDGNPPCLVCATPVPTEPRGSRIPDLIRECAADPLFHDAAFKEFTPEEVATK